MHHEYWIAATFGSFNCEVLMGRAGADVVAIPYVCDPTSPVTLWSFEGSVKNMPMEFRAPDEPEVTAQAARFLGETFGAQLEDFKPACERKGHRVLKGPYKAGQF